MDGLYEQIRIGIHQVWRRRWLALAVAWGLCVLGWLAVALIPNSYESKARVFVQMQSILPNQVGITVQEREGDLNRVKQTLTSSENLAKVVKRTELASLVASERDLAVQVGKLREAIKVTAQPDNMFEISATAKVSGFSNRQNAKLAAAVVQGLLDIFVEQNLAGDRDEANQSLAFLDQQLKARETQLQEAEQRRVEFEQRYLGLLPGEGSIASRMGAARTELAGIEQQLMQAQSSLSAMRSQLAATPSSMPAIGGDSGGGARGQLAQLEGQLSQYSAQGWTDSHPDVIRLKNQIARVRPLAAREPAGAGSMPNPSWVSLRAMVAEKEGQVSAAATRKAQLQSDLAQLGTRQASEPGVAAEQERLNRDYDVLKRQYDKLLEDRDQVRLRTDVRSQTDAVKFKVIDPPSQPSVPLTPNRPLLLTLILFVGLGAGAGAAFVLGQIQTTFPTQTRLSNATGLPVLGSIGEVFTEAKRAKYRQRLVWLGGGGAALGAAWALLMAVEFWQRSTVA
ncbi:MAG TPA: XrtA system polysaccharide chain length determinant [Allosphingosinicella sp.]|nr:XrtA system polysaccharide chain length determinant [Allosphingosinicella sp.]